MNSDKTSDKEDPQKQLKRGKGGLLDPERKIQGTQEQQEVKVTDSNCVCLK